MAVSPAGRRVRLDWQVYRHNIRAAEVAAFVRRQVRRHGRVTVVMDRWNAHRSAAAALRDELGDRLRVEWLPAYSPDLNPAEQIWNHAKYTDLANFVPRDVVHLARRVGLSFYHQSRDTHLLRSFYQTAGLRL